MILAATRLLDNMKVTLWKAQFVFHFCANYVSIVIHISQIKS